jgi:hypothetical protein
MRIAMRTLFIILSLCIASMTWAQSDQPAPAKLKGAPVEKKAPSSSPKPAANNKQGTKEIPLVVEILPAKKTNEDAATETQEREEKATNERVARGGIYANIVLSFLLVMANGALFLYTRKAANAAKKSAEVAERGLLELESARIQINLPPTQPALMWGSHAGPAVDYNLTNHGRTPATIVDARVKMIVFVGDQWPDRGTAEEFTVHDTTRNLLPGGSTEGFHASLGRELTDAEEQGLRVDKGHRVYFVGRIKYDDIFRRRHTRWFCYKRFPVVNDPKRFSWAERGPEQYNEETIEPAPSAS